MKRSSERILTTHPGALPQPADLKQMHSTQISGQPVDPEAFAKRVREVVAQVVKKQLDCDLDIINDGEVGKSNFSRYARERLSGFIEREVKAAATSSEFSATGRSNMSVNGGCNRKSVISKPASKDRSTRRLFSPPSRPAPSNIG